MATVKIDGRWFMDSAAFGELKWSSRYRGGPEAASLRVDSTKRLPYRPGQLVEVSEMGVPVFAGTLLEPDGDTLHARGLYHQGKKAKSLDSLAALTTVPDTAITEGIARGVLNWSLPSSLSTVPVGDVNAPISISELLDKSTAVDGRVWQVDARGIAKAAVPPTTPRWYVTPGAGQLTVAEDSYVTTLYGRYLDSGTGLYATVSATDADAAARFGASEDTVELSQDGTLSMTAANATDIVTNALAMGASRPGWANGLRLASWELTTAGEARANLRAVKGGDMIRILGQVDRTIALGPKPYIDVIADEVSYEDGSEFIDIKPVGLEVRDYRGVLEYLLSRV